MGIQTFFNSDGTALTAVITIIGSDGNHVDPDSWPITNDPAIVLSSHPAATKTVTQVDTGVYKAVWSSLSPALTHGEIVFIAVDGDISGTAWSTWQIPVQVVHLPAKPGDEMDLVNAPNATAVTAIQNGLSTFDHTTDNIAGSVGSVTGGINTGSGVITTLDALDTAQDSQHSTTQAAVAALNDFDPATDVVAHVTLVDTTTTNTDMRGTDAAYTGVPPTVEQITADIDANSTQLAAILEDTGTTIPATIAPLITSGSSLPVERSVDDAKRIMFQWPVSGATITAQVSIDNGSYTAVAGAISFLRTESSKHYYTLAYNAADRPSNEGVARYKLTDGTYTRYFNLRVAQNPFDSNYADHKSPGTFGKLMDIIRKANLSIDGSLSGTPTVNTFDTDLTDPDGTHNHQLLVFTAGSLEGISRPILSYSQTDGQIVLQEDLPFAPSSGDEFTILIQHIHPVSEIQNGLATQASVDDIPTIAEFEARTLPSGDYFNSYEDEVIIGSATESGVASIFSTYSLSESYAASGVEGTPAQILYFIQQTFSEFAISGVYITVSKLDGTTTAAQFILDDEDTPLSRSRIS